MSKVLTVQMTEGQLLLTLNAVALRVDVTKQALIAEGFNIEQAMNSVDIIRLEVLERSLLEQLNAATNNATELNATYVHAEATKKTI
jgi:hypothetical protein